VKPPGRVLEHESTVYAACAVTFAIGLVFIFVRAPHPWGVEGFDHYHQLALTVASGRMFPTMDVPWGYAYFLAAFYRAFGDHPAIQLTAQVVLNAFVPLLVYRLATHWVDARTATLAALLTGVLSFNTVYASTQSSDAVCTVIFLAGVLAFVRATTSNRLPLYALAGLLFGLAPQFRPNLILVPGVLAVYALASRGGARQRLAGAAMLIACTGLALAPWTIRNYRLTRMLVPASVHSGVQLWYGTLQVGPYLHSRAYNPRNAFESGVFRYTSLDHAPLLVTVRSACTREPAHVALTYWTHNHPVRHTIDAMTTGSDYRVEVPAPAAPDVVYYTVAARRPDGSVEPVPNDGWPLLYFVSRDHLRDMDLAGDLLDVFDLVRMMRHGAWREPLAWSDHLAAAGFHDDDLEAVVRALTKRFGDSATPALPAVRDFRSDDRQATATLADGSTITVPRAWRERITDVTFSGGLASALIPSTVALHRFRHGIEQPGAAYVCVGPDDIDINTEFYRLEPHLMRRYTALALDNIERTPAQFALAALFRVVRLFIVWGTDDPATMQQFRGGRVVTAIATVASLLFAALFLLGAIVSWRRGDRVALPLLLVAYVPATIAPMLTNMRYTVTMQPVMFVFVAVALIWLRERASKPEPTVAAHGRVDS